MSDDSNVVKLRQTQQPPASQQGVASSSDDPINPKSLLNMTELEQNVFLEQLRERRLRAAQVLKKALEAKAHATSIASAVKLERKAEQVTKQLERATKALDKLEELIYDMRALSLQYTDVDITK